MLAGGPVLAGSITQPTMMGIEVYHVGIFRDADFPDSIDKNTRGAAFLLDTNITKWAYWHNRVWTMGNESKLYTGGWEYELGLQAHPNVDLFHYHHSQHSFDEFTTTNRYPLSNFFGVRFNFLGGK